MSASIARAVVFLALLAPIAHAGDKHVVRGTVAVEDEQGGRHPIGAGSIQFWLGGQGGELIETAITDGRFVLDLPRAHGWLDVGPISADGVACWALPSWADATMPTTAELVAHRVKPAFARFVDAKTGAELDKGFVFRPANSPDEDDRAVAPLAAPFEIPLFAEREADPYRGWIGLREYVVTPREYASRRIWLDPSAGGTRTFEFERAATLLLWLPIAGIGAGHQVRITRDGSSVPWPCGPVPPVCGTTNLRLLAVRDLPAGSWTVRVVAQGTDVDTFPPMHVELEADAKGEIRYPGSSMGRANTRPIESAVLTRCELRGTLRLPDGIDPRAIRLQLDPSFGHAFGTRPLPDIPGSALVRDPHDARLVHWYGGSVPEGRWIARIPELGWMHEFATAHDAPVALDAVPSPASVDVRAPVSATVRFRVVDGPSGEELGPDRVLVRAHTSGVAALWNAGDRMWSLITATGTTEIDLERRGESRGTRTLIVDATSGETTLTFWPPLWIEVRAYDGDARIGAPELKQNSKPIVEALGHDGRATCPTVTMLRENSYRDLVSQPGRYRVTLAPNTRYAPTEPVEVEVKLGEPTPIAVFRLTRAKR